MTKRFSYDSALEKVYDYDKPVAGTFESYGVFECYEIINALNDENEQLKSDAKYWGKTAEARLKEIDKLQKDNTILKQQRDYLFDVIDEVLPHSGSTTVYNRMKKIGDVE